MRRAPARILIACGALCSIPAAAAAEPGLDLDTAVKRAIEHNERALAAEARSSAAEARVSRARAAFLPDVTLSAGYTRRREASIGDADADVFDATLQASVKLFDARSFPIYRQAGHDRDAAHLESLDARREVAFDAAGAFIAALGNEQVVAAAQRRVELAELAEKDARARVGAELESSNDVTRAELERATAERELTAARAELAAAYLELGFLIDDEVHGPLVEPHALLDAAAQPTAEPTEVIATARTRRLDIVAGYQRVAALEAFADEPRARIWPRLDLLGQTSLSTDEGVGGRDADWFVAVTATWEVWDGGERAAERRERLANARAAELELQSVERGVDRDVRRAEVALGRAQAAVTQAETVVRLARRNADESLVLYRQDLARALEVSDANAQLFDAEVALARERFGMATALLGLRAALGLDPMGDEVAR